MARLGLLWLALAAAPAGAQNVVTSPRPDRVAVTVYRDLARDSSQPFNLQWLGGYALITETRQVALPAGETELRFEGVAGGMIPQSAIVTGLPEGVVERNRDALLLSPATLLDRSLGARVHIRRTSRATGRVTETDAVIRAGADGAVALETPAGVEALRCTGLPETLLYDGVPPGLSPRPTLSVRARANAPVSATVTLSYLANGFDWQATYIAQMSEDGERLDLFAWMTLASSDETSFADADVNALAGRPNREDAPIQPREGGPLTLHCWPHATTSDIPLEQWRQLPMGRGRWLGGEEIEVDRPNLTSTSPITAISSAEVRTMAQLDELGDFKLYHIPEPVTLAARSQKQVALLERADVRFSTVYNDYISRYEFHRQDSRPAYRILRMRNRAAEGLGLPLPGGRLALFAQAGGRPILLGEGYVGDHAVGEEVEIGAGRSAAVRTEIVLLSENHAERRHELSITVTNGLPRAVRYEADLDADGGTITPAGGVRLGRRDRHPFWAVMVPAHGRATLRYAVQGGR
ncbi:MAG TPA: hypothetical protein VGW40_02235 [Allosphingosinicella sp.]|nr:hypothetical protein [Allosphingosinicella sp.]